MRSSVLLVTSLLASLAALVAPAIAGADDVAASASCGDAFDQAQVKRDEGKLLEARKLLRTCGGPACSPTQQKYCSGWLADVEARIPSVVPSAKNGAGVDLVDVKVRIDGVQAAAKLDGRAIDVDPGQHAFVFELANGTKTETTAVAVERGKGKVVPVTFGQAAGAPLSAPLLTPPGTQGSPATTAAAPGGSSLRTVGMIAGIAGVVGLGLGAAFGIEALGTKSSDCGANGACEPAGSASKAYSQATSSTVGFIAGGVLLAGGVTLFLVAPHGASEHAAVSSVALTPLVSPGPGGPTGGLALTGKW